MNLREKVLSDSEVEIRGDFIPPSNVVKRLAEYVIIIVRLRIYAYGAFVNIRVDFVICNIECIFKKDYLSNSVSYTICDGRGFDYFTGTHEYNHSDNVIFRITMIME